MLEELQKGHIGQRFNLKRSDEIGQMAKAMDNFKDKLQNMYVKIVRIFINKNNVKCIYIIYKNGGTKNEYYSY